MRSRVKFYRMRAGLTQAELAALAGVNLVSLAHVEQGRLKPWPALRRRLAEALGVGETELFGDWQELDDLLGKFVIGA